MSKSRSLWQPKSPVILNYGIAVLSVTAALIIARWIESVLQSGPEVSLFICAVMLSAWFGGIGPGVLAVVLSFLAFAYHFLPPIYSLAMEVMQIPRFLIFVLSALYIVPPVFPRNNSC
jgi:K+-sensing histidine kinase KdpD